MTNKKKKGKLKKIKQIIPYTKDERDEQINQLKIKLAIVGISQVTNNIQEKFLLSSKYPLNIIFNEKNEPRPYIKLDRGLKALISRPVFYNMVDLAVKGKNNNYGLWSDNQFFPIGKYSN